MTPQLFLTTHSEAACLDSFVDQITSNDHLGTCLMGRQGVREGQSAPDATPAGSSVAPLLLNAPRSPSRPRVQYLSSDSPQLKFTLAKLMANGTVGGGAGARAVGARDVIEYLETDTIHVRLINADNSCIKLLKYGESFRASSSQSEPVAASCSQLQPVCASPIVRTNVGSYLT